VSTKAETEVATAGAFKAVEDFLSERIRWADNALKLSFDEKFGESDAEDKRRFDTFLRDGRLMGIVSECYDIANHFGLDLGICKACYEDKDDLIMTHKAHKNDFTAHASKTLAELSGYLHAAIEVSDSTIAELQEELKQVDDESDEWSEHVMDIESSTGNGVLDYRVLKLLNIKTDLCDHCVTHMDQIWEEIIHQPKKDNKRSDDELPMAYR
jgi:hypothetical protein